MIFIRVFLFFVFLILINGFAFSQVDSIQKGTANYYSDKMQGRRTFTAEKYNKNAFTAAHATLPMNTMVKVTNLKNGKTTIVRINDRCSNNAKRVVDLSKAAAKEIDMIRDGVVQVKVEVLPADYKTQMPIDSVKVEIPADTLAH
ncbi:MAG: septal ring lytic transglycosylase RlpA family protein [Bacteroidota bacterium]